jgi:hypothetical protein
MNRQAGPAEIQRPGRDPGLYRLLRDHVEHGACPHCRQSAHPPAGLAPARPQEGICPAQGQRAHDLTP